ncbi:MAG: sugar phosphate isomerase/epimerase family protein [Candidatus Humimicrobiaceae bacterium]
MKLGINNGLWEITGIKLENSLPLIKSYGFKYVDVFAVGSGNPVLLDNSRKLKISKLFQKKELTASNMVCIPPGNISSTDKDEREVCLKYIKSCAEFQSLLGGRQILLGAGGGQKTMRITEEEAWINSVNFISEVCDYLYKSNMYLTLELEPFIFLIINSTYKMIKMIEEVDAPNLFANIDIGHLAITREAPVQLKKLKNCILHVHISDNGGEKHANAIIGSGCAMIKESLHELLNMDLDESCKEKEEVMVAALELGEIGQKIEDLDFYVRESINYINKFVPQLKYD